MDPHFVYWIDGDQTASDGDVSGDWGSDPARGQVIGTRSPGSRFVALGALGSCRGLAMPSASMGSHEGAPPTDVFGWTAADVARARGWFDLRVGGPTSCALRNTHDTTTLILTPSAIGQ